MYTGSLGAASNRATWTFSVAATDPDTDLAINLTGAAIEIAIRAQEAKLATLTGSLTDGRVALIGAGTNGQFTVTFSATDMANLVADFYDVGVRVTVAGGTKYQLIVATLTVVDGVVDA